MITSAPALSVLFLAVAASSFSLDTTSGVGSDQRKATTACDRRSFLSTSTAAAGAGAIALFQPTSPALAKTNLPETGKKAPDFELPNSRGDGTTTSLADLTRGGRWTVLYFYPGAFTKGCTLEARNFQRDIDQYRTLKAQIVGVSVDSPEKNAQFCSSESLDYFMLSDDGGAVSKAYGSALRVPGIGTFSNRQTYLIDPSGNLRYVFTDVESRIVMHSEEVLEKLKELA